MTETPTPTDTPTTTASTDDQPLPSTVDVAIVGAGPAGAAAGVFTARADFETLVLGDGTSTLEKCAHLENYLGFPAGIRPKTFRRMTHDHVREAGAHLRDETVERLTRVDDTFELETTGGPVTADAVIVASWSDTSFLEGLDVDLYTESQGDIDVFEPDADGRTDVSGFYAAGRIARTHHQAIVAAGDGARVALTLINDERPDFYNDWVVPEGYYAYHDREVPPGVDAIDHDERQQRVERAHDRLRRYFEDETSETTPQPWAED